VIERPMLDSERQVFVVTEASGHAFKVGDKVTFEDIKMDEDTRDFFIGLWNAVKLTAWMVAFLAMMYFVVHRADLP
jgi:hypothetical protein